MEVVLTEGILKIGEEISSYSDNLAFGLTNPNFTSPRGFLWNRQWTPGQTKWRSYLSEGIIYSGENYRDVEQAYQLNKPDTEVSRGLLMIELLIIKLSAYPKLVEGINYKGGLQYLADCTHSPTRSKSYWETGGKNAFIRFLVQAYLEIK